MVMANINSLLPAELLERVFGLVPPLDLRAVVLVCRRWREVGEVPGLWAWVLLRTDMPEALPVAGVIIITPCHNNAHFGRLGWD